MAQQLNRQQLMEAAKEAGINNIPTGMSDDQLTKLIQDTVKSGRTGIRMEDDRAPVRMKGVPEKKKKVPSIPVEVLENTEAVILSMQDHTYPVKIGKWEGEIRLNVQYVVPLYVAMHLAETGAAIIVRIEQDVSKMVDKGVTPATK